MKNGASIAKLVEWTPEKGRGFQALYVYRYGDHLQKIHRIRQLGEGSDESSRGSTATVPV